MLNGKLLLVSGERDFTADAKKHRPDVIDTLEFIKMENDSLILNLRGTRYGFHRMASASEANAVAQAAEQRKAQ
jgi:hypothetical protein